MQLKNKFNFNYFQIFFIIIFALSVNQYFGNKGIFPVDSFSHYDTGYRVLNGEFPFKDYWAVSGPFVDLLQAFIFFIFGYSWQAYLLNGSIVNALFAVFSFKLFLYLGLENRFAFLYALFIAILAYPVSSTPFVDLHSTYFSLFAIYFYLFAQIKKNYIYWFFIPVFICSAFLSKQVPAFYLFIGILFLIFFYFINSKFDENKKIFLILLISSIICLFLFFLFLNFCQISFKDFYNQYIGFPIQIGSDRFNYLKFSFKNLVLDFKIIHMVFILYAILIFYQLTKKKFFIKKINFNVFLSSLIVLISLVYHQLLTKNQIFIFFLIPFFTALTHIEFKNLFQDNKSYFKYFLLTICLISVIKYNERFNLNRKFHELSGTNFANYVNGDILDKKFLGLKWITPEKKNKNSVISEVNAIKSILNILREDLENKMVITNYSFISVILGKSQNGISRWYPPRESNFPVNGNKYFNVYKNFFISIIKKKKIKNIYLLYDVKKKYVTDYFPKECIIEKYEDDLYTKFAINNYCL